MRQIPRLVPFYRLSALYRLAALSLAALSLLGLSGCGPKSPEEQVAATRAEYTVKLESFTVHEPAPELELVMVEESAEGAQAAEDAAEAIEAAEMEDVMEAPPESGPRTVNVDLHLLVRFGGDKALPGITVEVTQADPFGKEGEPTLHWIDTAGMGKSDVKQVDLTLEGVEFEDGNAFSVLLSQQVPAAERSKYREFAEAGR